MAIPQIDEILNKNGNSNIDSIVVCIYVNFALSHIENTIMNLSIALLKFNIIKIYEFLDSHFTNDTAYNELREHVPKFSNKPLDSYSCDEILKLVLTMEEVNKITVQEISNHNRSYSLFNLIKSGNNEQLPNETYKHCYKDIMSLLLSNRSLFNKFITLGSQAAYNELQEFMLNSFNPINKIKNFFVEFIPLDTPLSSYNKASLSQEEEMQFLSIYYSNRNVHLAATSLSAVTFAQKQLRTKSVRPFFEYERYNERRSVINKWKKKADNNEDDGLSLALEKVCNELNISEIDNPTYHKLSMILNKLVIYSNKTPTNYTPQLFVQEFKDRYKEESKDSHHNSVKLKIT